MSDLRRYILRLLKKIEIPIKIRRLIGLIVGVSLIAGSCLLLEAFMMQFVPLDYKIPTQSDWIDYGKIFDAGELGEWDYQLYGGFTNSIIKRNGIFYLYYQGASGYRTVPDETVTWRAIGVATSSDGINFTKSDKNPVITWFPNGNGEEGAVSAGTSLDNMGNVVLHYGANTQSSESHINADVRAAVSQDGVAFTDIGAVIKHGDPNIWGSSDEIFPIISIHDGDRWLVYYLPNGIVESGWLGVAWGDRYDSFTKSKRTRSGFLPVKGWGTGSAIELAPDNYALFINNIRQGNVQVRLMSLSNPTKLSSPVETYRFDEVLQASIYLDKEAQTWFMFYRSEDYYGVKIAPATEKDITPPSAPEGVQAAATSESQVTLTWEPSIDLETGVSVYKVYREGKNIATVKGWSYEDAGLSELLNYAYQVQAVNYHGIESPLSEVVSVTSLADISAPHINSVSGFQDQVIVILSEPLEEKSAINISNYIIPNGLDVLNAVLDASGKKVTLTTMQQNPNSSYTLRMENIMDRAKTPNIIDGESIEFTSSSIPGLVGEWSMNEGLGETATDRSNYGNDGYLIYVDKPGPDWVDGILESALRFDGMDDQVWIPLAPPLLDTLAGNYSIALWVKPESTPENTSSNNQYYSILSYANMGLSYHSDKRFYATVWLENGEKATVSSEIYNPKEWRHLVMVVETNTQNLRLYVDGKETDQSPTSFPASILIPSRVPIFIGTSDPLEGRYENRLKGLVDQVKIYSRATTEEEILSLYQDERP